MPSSSSSSLDFAIPPTSPQSTSSSGSDEALEIREKAFELLNRIGGPKSGEDKSNWPQRPSFSSTSPPSQPQPPKLSSLPSPSSSYQDSSSSYQQQGKSYQNSSEAPKGSTEAGYHYHNDESSSWSVVEGFVQCVSDACKLGASEIVSQQKTVFQSGYRSIKSVVVPEVEERILGSTSSSYGLKGSYQTVNLPKAYQGRYSDGGSIQ